MLKVQLVVVQGKPEGKAIPVTSPTFKIGRSEACQLRPSSEEVSREHAELTVSETGVNARDLGSRNGTMLNGKPLPSTATPLKNGDLIQIGKLTFAISIQGLPTTAPVRPVSLDEVDREKIDQWLVADPSTNVPDRPSGVYGGDTLTVTAYKEGGSGSHKAVAAGPAGAPAASTTAASANAAAAAAPLPAAPAAAPVPAAPAQPAPVPVAVPVAASAAPPVAPAAPAAAPAPMTAVAVQAPEAAFAVASTGGHSFLDTFLDNAEFEQMAEGAGDEAQEVLIEDPDEPGAGGASGSAEEEFIDESNPFYAAKKAQMLAAQEQQQPGAKKDPYKDSSDAAHDILRRMTDRRRSV